MHEITGLHHVTAIAGDARQNLAFYTRVLGMRLVKKSVNQDDPGTYHLFYADNEGHPGTDLTFFPWHQMAPSRPGIGLTMEVALAVPEGSLDYWESRLAEAGVPLARVETRRGARALPLRDPHGMPVALVETRDARTFSPWPASPVPPDRQVLGLHSARLWQRSLDATADFLTGVLGFTRLGRDGEWHGYGVAGGGSGCHVEVRELPEAPRGAWGTGAVHHIAWRVADVEAELAVRQRVADAQHRPTDVIDRFWFKSVYFKEPGGALFELATDGPGFTADEDLATLGERLVLPPWLEAHRPRIEAALPDLSGA